MQKDKRKWQTKLKFRTRIRVHKQDSAKDDKLTVNCTMPGRRRPLKTQWTRLIQTVDRKKRAGEG